METGSGPFKKGERLTAQKLNQLADGVPFTVTGGALTHNPRGNIVHIDQPENIYIKLTGKTGTSPIKYGWKEVVRLANGTWLDTARTANYTDDYAVELNNSNLSTTDGYIYRSERSPHTGEWLFFLRRNRKCGIDGYCLRLPSTINFSTVSCTFSTANVPIWTYAPGMVVYSPDGCKNAEYPDGWVTWRNVTSGGGTTVDVPTGHMQSMIDYATCLSLYSNSSGALVKDVNTRTENDIKSLLTAYFPTPLTVKHWNGAIDQATDCPAYGGKNIYEYNVTKAVTYVEANLTAAPSCGGFNVAYKRGYDIEVQIKNSEYTASGTLFSVSYTNLKFATIGLTSNTTAPYYFPTYTNLIVSDTDTGSSGGDCDATGPNPFTYGNITFTY
jgi:hypothetical protein